MTDQKKISEILGKIFHSPDMQFGLSVFEGIAPEQVLNLSEKDGKYYLECLKRKKSIQAKTGKPVVSKLSFRKIKEQRRLKGK